MSKPKVVPISHAKRLNTDSIREVIKYIETNAVEIRENQCPVRTQYYGQPTLIREYLVPVSLVTTDVKSQRRRKGKNTSIVSQISRQFEKDGQSKAICCKVQRNESGEWEVIIRWGNHRWRAALSLMKRGSSIFNVPQEYIWVSVYNEYHADHELNGLQTIENNLLEASEPADDEDNLDSLMQAWTDGELDFAGKPFSQLDEVQQRKQLNEWIKKHMGANVKQPASLITKFYKRNTEKIRTDTKDSDEHQDHWNLHESQNFGGIKFTQAGKRNNTVEQAGLTHAQYHINANTFLPGSTVQQMTDAKRSLLPNKSPKVDVVHLIISLHLNVLKDGEKRIAERRAEWVEVVTHWNKTVGKIVDYLYIMPQTEKEEDAAKKGTPWIKRIEF